MATAPGSPPGPAALVMARAPVAGRVKTRLEPLLGPDGCARLQEALVRRTARWAVEVAPGAAFVAHDPPEGWAALAALVPPDVEALPQAAGDLGERLVEATGAAWRRARGRAPLLVVGVDTRLTRDHAAAALDALADGADVVFGPAIDGGYYLAGLARPLPEVFAIEPAAWGGPEVLERSIAAARGAGLRVATIATERDLDTPDDARAMLADPEVGELLGAAFARRAGAPEPDPAKSAAAAARPMTPEPPDPPQLVSLIVPTLDEAAELPRLLDHIATLSGRFETIVADGGSTDGTLEEARAHPARPRVITAPRGRALQMNAGAAAATGDPIVFLHADTRLPPTAYAQLTQTPAQGGNFELRFDGGDRFAQVLGAWYRLQRCLGAYYGDSAIWLRRAAFDALGGFRPLPIMEDYEMARRLEKGRFRTACLPGPAVTSSRRWRAHGVPRTVLSWVLIRWLFLAGVPPERLARLYRRAR